ncbi:hypothetical protein FI667_g7730, partial [Globisporangium splendens]
MQPVVNAIDISTKPGKNTPTNSQVNDITISDTTSITLLPNETDLWLETNPVVILDDDEVDDLAFIADDGDISQDIAVAPEASATAGSSATSERSETLDAVSEIASIRMDLWRCKKELMLQNTANAKLQHAIQQTRLLEDRLCGAKRKIQAIQEELRSVEPNSHSTAKKIHEELNFYVREKKRILDTLIKNESQ